MERRTRDVWAGVGIWAGLVLLAGAWVHARAGELARPLRDVAGFVTGRPTELAVVLSGTVMAGDPVLDRERRYVGRVLQAAPGPDGCRVVLALDPAAALPAAPRFEPREASGDGRWVLQTLLPPHKRELVGRELQAFAEEHRELLEGFLRPLAEDVVGEGVRLLQANLGRALDARKGALQALVERHRGKVKDELLPVLKTRLGPSAKRKAEPILREIGHELWRELPMWSLSWRVMIDVIPGTSQDRVDRWWAEFVETKAIPIVSAHESELLRAVGELLEEGARDPFVRQSLSDAARRLIDDPEFRELVRGVLEEALIRPLEVRVLVERLLRDPRHQARLQALEQAFAPTLRRLGHLLTMDPATGRIDPDLARVLRRVVFQKDARWVELLPAEPERP